LNILRMQNVESCLITMAQKMVTDIIRRLFSDPTLIAPELGDFDPIFYRAHYGDLRRLKSAAALRRHFVKHGRREGRWRNLTEAKNHFTSRFGPLPGDFQASMYRALNEDLARAFDHEWQFEFHYLESGQKEGRSYKREGSSPGDPARSWMTLFRLADFVACAQSWLDEIPQTKERAIAIFLDSGIDRLAPINLDFIFDPNFYRSAYGFDDRMNDATLYRHWLEIGAHQELAPNEEKALRYIMESCLYPQSFDWNRYKSNLPTQEAKSLRCRVDVLKHFFNTGFEKGLTKHIAGEGSDDLFAAIGDFHLVRGHHQLAISAYDRVLALDPSHAGVRHRRGDAYAALGKTVVAYADFAHAAALPNASVWSTIHWARTAAAVGSFEKSFEILRNAHPKWRKSADYRNAVMDLIEQYFAAKSRSAMALYDAGDRKVADAYLLKALDELRARIVEFEDLAAAIPPSPDGHVAILVNQDLAQCRHYRVEQKLRQFRQAGLKAELYDQHDPALFIRSLLGARAAIFYRVPAFPNIMRAILTAQALGIPTYYEIDDLIFDAASYPDIFASYEGQISKSEYNGLLYGAPLFRYAMELCDYGIASTTPLAHQIEPIVRKRSCFVLRNGLDERNARAIDMGQEPRAEREAVVIFYGSGTKAHNSDFNELAAPALLSAFDQYDHVRLVIVGHLRLRSEFERFSSRITQIGFVSDLDQYWSLLAAADINLAVLSPGLMASCKSEIKWLEAAVLQVPSVVSATATYREVLQDGVDALIVDDASAWRNALTRLIEDRGLRRSIGAAARCKALQNYSIETAAALWRNTLGAPSAATAKGDSRFRIKVLICAVFFPPQSYGGATRVVQDNVDYILDHCPDIELSAFASDDGVSPAGRFRFDQYRGIPVFRLSTPREAHMDWRPFNSEHADIFERILDVVQPTLIHFHCIQRLTASIVEVALKRNILYVITAHDGWWISDHQFLVDQDDILRLPSPDAYDAAPPQNISLTDSVVRRQRLAGLMQGAAQVICVSEAFANIYCRAGSRNVVAIPNGLSKIEPAPKQKSPRGRLSLGHIGGRSAHKGAMLIEAVFRMNDFDHLKLTMMDFSMQPGTRQKKVWGNTPVVLCGAYSQEQVADLYASLDVLLAPSIWPESFGLVAREARSQGLWVVASDRGAVAEGVRPGENGFIIDVADGRALTAILKKLDADVAHYQTPPAKSPEPERTAADQGREIAELYRKISDAHGSLPHDSYVDIR
jgi:glycosyltransferase involved in cell wall biosynthesis